MPEDPEFAEDFLGCCDEAMIKLLQKKRQLKSCAKGHLNGPNSRICWRCGAPLSDADRLEG